MPKYENERSLNDKSVDSSKNMKTLFREESFSVNSFKFTILFKTYFQF